MVEIHDYSSTESMIDILLYKARKYQRIKIKVVIELWISLVIVNT